MENSPNQQGSPNLLNDGDTLQDVAENLAKSGELVTEVTSVAKEEERTGQTIKVPSPEELVSRAASSLIIATKQINDLIGQKDPRWNSDRISRKGMNRVLNAILALPTDGLPVKLQNDAEKMAFSLGQKIINDRFIIMQHHINEEIKRLKLAKEQANVTEEQKGESNEQ